jgi:hypothetical protein
MNPSGTALPLVDKLRARALVVGVVGAALAVVGRLSNPYQFDRAYLFSFMFVLGLSLGSMALLMVHRQLGGAWGFLVRRPLEAGAMTLPLVAVLFIPILVDLERIYPWVNHPPGTESHAEAEPAGHATAATHGPAGEHKEAAPANSEGHPSNKTELHPGDQPEAKGNPAVRTGIGTFPGALGMRRDPLEKDTADLFAFKKWWLTPAHFTIRAAIYFFIWIVMAAILNVYSRRQDETRSWDIAYNLQSFSAPGIVVYFLTASLAIVDWAMSLEPEWYSSLFGVLLMIGQGLSTISFMIIMTAILSRRGETDGLDTHETFNDLGNLLLAFTMLWAYLSFSQFLIIWSGNLAEEIPWYARRLSYGWTNVGRYLMIFHFFLPFTILLCRPLKRNLDALKWVAGLMLVSRLVDVYWQITPSFNMGREPGPAPFFQSVSWQDLAVPAGVIGIWFAGFLTLLRGKNLMVVADPELKPALKQAGGH